MTDSSDVTASLDTPAAVDPVERCTLASRSALEPLAGTAPVAQAWLAVEQSGPWGRDALSESHLDAGLGAALVLKSKDHGVRPLLIRRPGRHADDHHAPSHRTVLIASTRPEATWLRRLDVPHVSDLLDLDLAAIGVGIEPDLGERLDHPVLLVCTNAKRDRCCAIEGRPAANAAAAAHPGRVWECTHLGGHRFAATALVLPDGFVHGRLDAASAATTLDLADQGRLDLSTARGRSTWSTAGQAAELFVRERLGLVGASDVLAIEEIAVEEVAVNELTDEARAADVRAASSDTDELVVVRVRTRAAGEHVVEVRAVTDELVTRAESCGKNALPVRRLVAAFVDA